MSSAPHTMPGGLDLDGLGDLASLLDGPQKTAGYTMYDVARIHLDKNNVRRAGNQGLTPESIGEMAASILERHRQGKRAVIVPISLRPHPTIPGDFIINHGHRRYLGTIEAGLTQIPGHEDHDFDDFDQVIENLQSEKLNGRELADFIGGKLAEGMTQADIARKLGKSKAWVSMHVSMLSLPEPVADAVANGQLTDVTLAKELAVAHREDPEAVEGLLQSPEKKPTRAEVKAIRKSAKARGREQPDSGHQGAAEVTPSAEDAIRIVRQASTHVILNDDAGTSRQASENPPSVLAAFAKMREERSRELAERPARMEAGEAALKRLLPIAQRDTGQSQVIARFLLNLYNGNRFPFDNTDLRRLDNELVEDCIAVLRMDVLKQQEVHLYFERGSKIWETLAKDWGFRDFNGDDSWRATNANV
ncbi:DUF7673 family protein [Achromobacter xylosoxidans]|uniref:DUF7673 family protein n=1 Tax=Alcaligenes xylosoxydans xylosoxydans TaxID=85698 RepID=UPI00292DE250|nr:ParB/RepB/Spo0J family partition protein [Achromobacter xylosoxidans]WOB74330.1 ParB/RepB/Spo0J family partition protein [Achromobacter xylosoxidans]